jgi:YegS/Rv2252/BmrU family lipid kinase
VTPQRPAVVFNPTKADDPEKCARAIREALSRAGIHDVRWLETTPEDGGAHMAKAAIDDEGVDFVFAWGGDGTVMSCITAVAETDVPLAVLPAGTGNLLANNFAIPVDLDAAVDVALHGERRRIDVGATPTCRYAVMGGMGFDAQMLRDADPALKAKAGSLAYVLSALKHLRESRLRFTLTLDDQPPVVRRGRAVLIGNLGKLQGSLWVLPDAVPDDGWLDVAILRVKTVPDWLRLAVNLLLRRTPPDHQLETWRAKHVLVTTDRPTPTETDGDESEPATRFEVQVLPRALVLCVPVHAPRGNREAAA